MVLLRQSIAGLALLREAAPRSIEDIVQLDLCVAWLGWGTVDFALGLVQQGFQDHGVRRAGDCLLIPAGALIAPFVPAPFGVVQGIEHADQLAGVIRLPEGPESEGGAG